MFLLRIFAVVLFFSYLGIPTLIPESFTPWYSPFLIWAVFIAITVLLFLPEESKR